MAPLRSLVQVFILPSSEAVACRTLNLSSIVYFTCISDNLKWYNEHYYYYYYY